MRSYYPNVSGFGLKRGIQNTTPMRVSRCYDAAGADEVLAADEVRLSPVAEDTEDLEDPSVFRTVT